MTPIKPTKEDLKKADEVYEKSYERYRIKNPLTFDYSSAPKEIIVPEIAQVLAEARAEAVKEAIETENCLLCKRKVLVKHRESIGEVWE